MAVVVVCAAVVGSVVVVDVPAVHAVAANAITSTRTNQCLRISTSLNRWI
jgi:hypothetical protein